MNLAFLEDRKYCNIQITHEERKIYSKKSPKKKKKGGSGDSPKE